MWVRFTKDFPWKPSTMTTISYKAGSVLNVRAECGETAIAKGAAVRMKKDRKDSDPVETGTDGAEG